MQRIPTGLEKNIHIAYQRVSINETPYCRLVSEGPIDLLLNMASSSIIAINIIVINIIIIIVHHRRRPKSLISFRNRSMRRFPAYGEEERKKGLYLRTKVLVGVLFLRLLLEAGQSFSVVTRAT